MSAANGIRAKNDKRLDEVQSLLEANAHLNDTERLEELLSKLSMYFNILSDEDRDYVKAARYAIDEQVDWSK